MELLGWIVACLPPHAGLAASRRAHYRPSPLVRVPPDVLYTLASFLERPDVLHLSLTCRAFSDTLLPHLYASPVELSGAVRCTATLSMLVRTPAVARHVRRLVVRPERRDRAALPEAEHVWDKAGVVSRLVVLAARHLEVLQAFEWDGEDLLPDDRMWIALRTSCPNLRSIGVTLGCFLPKPTSHCFAFENLKSFSLVFKDGFYSQQLYVDSRETLPVFTKLWDMLIYRCTNLQSLSMTGTSSELLPLSRLWTARWPHLRMLELGDAFPSPLNALHPAQWNVQLEQREAAACRVFLAAHPAIEELHLLGRPAGAPDLSTLDTDALPKLREFSGPLDVVRALLERRTEDGPPGSAEEKEQGEDGQADLRVSLRTLRLPHALHLRDIAPLTLAHVLASLKHLDTLDITLSAAGGGPGVQDAGCVVRTIASSCAGLRELRVRCVGGPGFYLDSFARALRPLPRLAHLMLSLTPHPSDEPPHAAAARLALSNPRLSSITLVLTTPSASARPTRTRHRAAFELVHDKHGLPVALRVREWRRTVRWATAALGPLVWDAVGRGKVARWRKAGRGYVRSWVCQLRSGAGVDESQSQGGRKSLRGRAGVLIERNPAGEEARMLAFCAGLVGLVLWTVLVRMLREWWAAIWIAVGEV